MFAPICSVREKQGKAVGYKEPLLPKITSETHANSKSMQTLPLHYKTTLPNIFENRAELRLPKTNLTKKGPLVLKSNVREVGQKREKKLHFQTININSEMNTHRDTLIPEVFHSKPIESTRDLKRRILNYKVQQSRRERDIKPGHSARRYLSYWRQSYIADRRTDSDRTGRGNAIKPQNRFGQSHKVIHLTLSPTPYQTPSNMKCLNLKCSGNKTPQKQFLRSNNGQIHTQHWETDQKDLSPERLVYKVLNQTEDSESDTNVKIKYPVYWRCSKIRHRPHEGRIGDQNIHEDRHQQLDVTDNASIVSSGNQWIRVKLAHLLNKETITGAVSEHMFHSDHIRPRTSDSVESVRMSKYTLSASRKSLV